MATQEKKGTIIFDLDDTLFDASALKEDIFKLLASSGISLSLVRSSYKKVRNQFPIYRIENHIKLLEQENGINISKDIQHHLHHFDRSPYVKQATKELLSELAIEYNIWLLTLGDQMTQMKKITDTDLVKHFDDGRIIITEKAKEKELAKISLFGKVFFVNDKLLETQTIAKHYPDVTCILVGNHNLRNRKNIFVISSIQYIKNILS